MLPMEEMQQANAATNAVSTALIAQARPPPPPCIGTSCRGDTSFQGKGKPANKPKTKGRRTSGGKQRAATTSTSALMGPWICFSPGAG
jgi:hypothetical protein